MSTVDPDGNERNGGTTMTLDTVSRRSSGFVIRLSISALLIGFFASRLDRHLVASALANVNIALVGAALALNFICQLISAFRWRVVARALGFRCSYRHFAIWYFEGMFFSLCLPTSIGGDVVKAVRLANHESERLRSAASVFVDRLCGLVALIAIGGAACAGWQWRWTASATLAAAASGCLAAAVVLGHSVSAILRLLEKVDWSRLATLVEKLSSYRQRPGTITSGVLLSFCIQALNVATVTCLGAAMGLKLPLTAYAMATPTAAFLAALPISVGGLGVREGGLTYMLGLHGLSMAQGVTLSLLWFVVIMITGLSGGVAYLFVRGSPTT